MVETGFSKSAAVIVTARQTKTSVASIWSWFRLINDVPLHDRLDYLVPGFRGGGRKANIDPRILDAVAIDYLRPEQPSWADCVRRVEVLANERGTVLPHARTLWRRLCNVYDTRST